MVEENCCKDKASNNPSFEKISIERSVLFIFTKLTTQNLCFISIVKRRATVITHFWVISKFISFKKKEKKEKSMTRCHFKRHCACSSPLRMQRQGRRRFLKCFFPLSLSPPNITHTLPPSLKKQKPMLGYLTLPPLWKQQKIHVRPPYPALRQGRVALSLCLL